MASKDNSGTAPRRRAPGPTSRRAVVAKPAVTKALTAPEKPVAATAVTPPVMTAVLPEVIAAAPKVTPVVEPVPLPVVVAAPLDVIAETAKTDMGYDIAALGRANIEIVLHVNETLSKGLEEMSGELVRYSIGSIESAAAATNAAFGAHNLVDLAALNVNYGKTEFEKLWATTARLGELATKLASESVRPFTEQTSRLMESIGRPAA